MSKQHTCVNTATTIDLRGPPPCEACAEMPRCPHGMRYGLDKCESCDLRAALVGLVQALEDFRLLTGVRADNESWRRLVEAHGRARDLLKA